MTRPRNYADRPAWVFTVTGGAPLLPRRLTDGRIELTSMNRNGQLAELTYRVTEP